MKKKQPILLDIPESDVLSLIRSKITLLGFKDALSFARSDWYSENFARIHEKKFEPKTINQILSGFSQNKPFLFGCIHVFCGYTKIERITKKELAESEVKETKFKDFTTFEKVVKVKESYFFNLSYQD
jgi:hypothetical protein